MAWENPVTTWGHAGQTVPRAGDFNRIEGNTQYLKDEVDSHKAADTHIPRGLIAMWSGPVSAIPAGWALCDGTNGTPNLKDRFIMGATTDATINKTGGQNEVTLTIEQMPRHRHTGSTNTTGSHTHLYYWGEDQYLGASGMYGGRAQTSSTSSAGAHSHTVTTDYVGGGQPHENRPAFYTLAFIMKL
jgi:microcystin-dependent protein